MEAIELSEIILAQVTRRITALYYTRCIFCLYVHPSVACTSSYLDISVTLNVEFHFRQIPGCVTGIWSTHRLTKQSTNVGSASGH